MVTKKIKVPVGEEIEIQGQETPEEIAAREAAEAARLAEEEAKRKKDQTDETEEQKQARLAAEEEARKKAEQDANKSKIKIVSEDGKENEYTLDADGNALDADGKTIYTAAQIKEFEEENDDDPDEETTTIEDISKVSGISILSDDGKPKVYEQTVEGFAQREVDIKQLGYKEGVAKGIQDFFKANPEFEAMANYKKTYGSLENYSEFVDYSKVTLSADNEAQLVDIIIKAELVKGSSPERAKKFAEFSKNDGSLFADAQDSLNFLNKHQEDDRIAAERRDQEIIQKSIQDEYNYYGVGYDKDGKEVILNVENSIYDLVVNKGTIGNIMIPKDGLFVKDKNNTTKHLSRRQIFDYIYTPVADIDGELYSQAQIDEYNRLSSKDELVSTYIRNLLGGDVSQLVEVSKRKDNANAIRTFKVKSKQSAQSSKGGSKKVVIPVK